MKTKLFLLTFIMAVWMAGCASGFPENGGGAGMNRNQIGTTQTQAAGPADSAAQASADQAALLALAVQGTQQAIQLQATQAAATLVADQARSTTAANAQATGTAQFEQQATQVAAGQGTATASANAQATGAAALARAQTAQLAQDQAIRIRWRVFWRVVGAVCFLSTFIGLGVMVFKTLPWVLHRYFGWQEWNGKPIAVFPNGKGGLIIADIARSLEPGLVLDTCSGSVESKGGFENAQIQDQVAARAQAAELLLAANQGQGQPSRARKEQAIQQAFQGAFESDRAPYYILPSQEQLPSSLARPETIEVLEAEWRNIDD